MNVEQYKVAGFWERLAAAFLSWFLWAYAALKLYEIFAFEQIKYAIGLFFLLSVLDQILLGVCGYTVLQFLLGLRCVDAHSAEPIGIMRALLRYLFAVFSFLFFGLGYVAAFFDPAKRTVHDFLISSALVRDSKLFFVSGFIAKLLIIPAFLFSLALVAVVPVSSYLLAKSYLEFKKPITYNSLTWQRQPSASLVLPLSNQTATALVEIKGATADYLPFGFEVTEELNQLSSEALNVLGINVWDLSYKLKNVPESLEEFLNWDMSRVMEISLERFVLLDQIIFKDSQGKDLVLNDVSFYIGSDTSHLGRQSLAAFDYLLDFKRSILQLNLYSPEQKYFADPDLSETMRNLFTAALNQLRLDWYQAQESMPASLIESLSQKQSRPVNTVVLMVDAVSGYVTEARINKASDNQEYNEFCKQFLASLAKFPKMPAAYQENYKGYFNLELDLDARF